MCDDAVDMSARSYTIFLDDVKSIMNKKPKIMTLMFFNVEGTSYRDRHVNYLTD